MMRSRISRLLRCATFSEVAQFGSGLRIKVQFWANTRSDRKAFRRYLGLGGSPLNTGLQVLVYWGLDSWSTRGRVAVRFRGVGSGLFRAILSDFASPLYGRA